MKPALAFAPAPDTPTLGLSRHYDIIIIIIIILGSTSV